MDINTDLKQIVDKYNRSMIYTGKSVNGYGHTYFAKNLIKKGTVVVMGFGKIIPKQTGHISIQIDYDKHYLPTLFTGKYFNHSCDPNLYVVTREDGFPNWLALRDINNDEEITYGYWMTEYTWGDAADENTKICQCSTDNCTGRILSFKQISEYGIQEITKISKYLLTPPT